ncbi:hypothetical protein Cch01nite_14470 [Cellulomonas chitinilytica]|uniref:HTH arsR-type domain-containing protein n=1 Tax=Cellulomonas chitinilytica TaxID=398759 RepID=A0A919TZC7_9CELL|nr:hypothetical protein Cch01nite_14470 [Cellulomonas chitinilytica]
MRAVVAFTADDVARARFAVSPSWQVVTSFRMLARTSTPAPFRTWVEHLRPAVRAAGLDRGWLAELVPTYGYLADLLTPCPPPSGPPDLTAELDVVRATDPDRVRLELDMLAAERAPLDPRRVVALRREPARVLVDVAAEVRAYWDLALAPHWSRIHAVLDADLLHRARQVAEQGTGAVLNELHGTVRWDEGSLHLVRRHCEITRDGTGHGLVLLPNVFVGDAVLTRAVPPEPPQLSYPARGAGTIWGAPEPDRPEALAGVLGRTRTTILRRLDAPASTTALAHELGLSPAGVSGHLTAMRDAGLVRAARDGRAVLYTRTEAADALLST